MGISWSVGLREDQVFDKAKGEVDRKNWATLNSALQDETAARESVDAKIIADKDSLWEALQDESTLRARDDYELRQEFLGITSSETSIRAAADVSLKAALDSDITAVKALIETEKQERITNDSAVIEQVNNKYDPQITDINAAIANENTLAAERDEAIYSDLSASITAEQKSRGDGDAALQTAINNLGKSAVDSVRAEINARQSADTTLQQNIDKVATSITSGSFTVSEFQPSSTTQEGKAGILPAPPKLQTEDQILLPTNFGWKSLADTNIFIGTTPSQKFVPQYTGSVIYPQWNDYEEQKMSVSGDLSARAAGTYTVYFKPVGLYCWSDGTRGERAVQWTIAPDLIAIPTAATTTFDYTGNVISLNPANVDLTKMDKNGQDSATEQGNYAVTYTLKDPANVHWSNNSTAPITINWKIELKALAKPSAANTTFTYDGNTKKLDVDNYNASFMTVTGTTSEINAGTYKVTYALKNKASMQWSDGTTNDVTITWTINRQKMTYAESNLTANPLEYTGNKQSVSLNGYNSAKHVLSGDTTGTAAGSYTVTVTPNENYEWYEGGYDGKQVTWSIGSMSFAKPTAATTTFTYTGNAVSLNVQNVNLTYMDKTGSDTATAKGTYWVKYTLKSPSYTWDDGSKDPVTINWSIGENAVAIPTLTETNYVYNDKSQTPKIANGASDKFTVTGTTAEINAGTYTITYTLNDPTNTKWADGTNKPKTIEWTIQRKPLTAAQSTFTPKTITYDGNAKNLADNLTGYNATYHDLSSQTSMTKAGTYTAKVAPKANYAWSDGTYAAQTVKWTINPKSIAKPTAEKTSFDYDGATKTLSFKNYDSALMTKSGTDSASAKNSYKVTFTLNDTKNYCWADGTTTPHDITWTIGANSVAKPTISGATSFYYDYGRAKSITVDGYDSGTMIFSGTTSETEAGEYTAVYKLKDKTNYAWSDGTNDDVVFNWKINLRPLAKTTSSNLALKKTTYEWSGTYDSALDGVVGNLTFGKADFNGWSDYVEITGGNYIYLSQSKPPLYDVNTDFTIEVSPIKNFCWNDGTRTPLVFHFKITEKLLDKPTISGDSSFTYDGTTKSITVTNYDSNYMKQSGTLSASNVNSYQATYSLHTTRLYHNATNSMRTRFIKWKDGSTDAVTLDWAITAGSGITKPTLSTTEYEWTGGSISPDIKGYNSSTMNVSGTTTASAINTYTVTYSLKDKTNTKWADGTTADVSLTWKIVRQKLTNDVTVDSDVTISYNGNSQQPTLKYGSVQWTMANLATYCDLSSQTSATDAGTYTFKATPKSTYAWKDGSTAAKSFDWEINKDTISSFSVRNKSTGDVLPYTLPSNETTVCYPSSTGNLVFNEPTTLTFEYSGDATLAFCNGRIGDLVTGSKISTSGNTTTYKFSDDVTISITGKDVTFTPLNYIDTSINIYVRLVDGANYAVAPATRYIALIRFIPQRIKPLNDCTWADVLQIIQSGRTADIWQVGDYKVFDSNGGSVTTELDGKTSVDTYPKLAMTLIGIDHNPDVEGRKRAHFMLTHWTATSTGTPVSALFKSTNATFHMTPQGSFGGVQGYTYSYFKQVVANQILNMLPSDLKNIISPVTKWTADRAESHSVTDKIFLLSAKEVLPGYSGWSGLNNVVYDYFANGNYLPGIADKTKNVVTVVPTWTRDFTGVADGVAKFQVVQHFENASGSVSHHGAEPLAANNTAICYTYLPCFTIA